MASFKRIFREYLNTVRDDIVTEMRARNMPATGLAERTLRVVANQHLEAQIRGQIYIGALETGVGSKPRGVGNSLIRNLMVWMKAKGVSPLRNGKVMPSNTDNLRRSAWGIAISLVRRGTAIYRGAKGIDLKAPIKDNMPKLLQSMGTEIVIEFKDKLTIKR